MLTENSRAPRRVADTRVALAHALGSTVPADVSAAQARLAKLLQIVDDVNDNQRMATLPALSDVDVDDLYSVVEEYARVAESTRLTRTAAELMVPAAARSYEEATRLHLSTWFTDLKGQFTSAWADFRTVSEKAPLNIDVMAAISPEEVTAYSKTINLAGQLDHLLGVRVAFGTSLHEDDADAVNLSLIARAPARPEGDPDTAGLMWQSISRTISRGQTVVLTPKTLHEQSTMLEWERPNWASIPNGHHRWRRLVALELDGWTVAMTTPSEAAQNAEHINEWGQWANKVRPILMPTR